MSDRQRFTDPAVDPVTGIPLHEQLLDPNVPLTTVNTEDEDGVLANPDTVPAAVADRRGDPKFVFTIDPTMDSKTAAKSLAKLVMGAIRPND